MLIRSFLQPETNPVFTHNTKGATFLVCIYITKSPETSTKREHFLGAGDWCNGVHLTLLGMCCTAAHALNQNRNVEMQGYGVCNVGGREGPFVVMKVWLI